MLGLSKYQDDKLLAMSRQFVKVRDRDCCVICGTGGYVEVHHIFFGASKSIWLYRYDPLFSVTLHLDCHQADGRSEITAHHNPTEFMELLKSKINAPQLEAITEKRTILPFPGFKAMETMLKLQLQTQEQEWMDGMIEAEYAGRVGGKIVYRR